MTNSFLQTYVASRETLQAEIVERLAADERFTAAWLTGSFGRNDADAVSDLDLTLVVAEPFSETLCARPEQVSAGTTPERLELFSHFGQPIVTHENNHNAPEGGTFTFVLYAPSALMVDWILVPQSEAQRPVLSRLLFEKAAIPLSPMAQPEPLEQRLEQMAEIIAFFWMMTAVTAKYIYRGDSIFVQRWLEELNRLIEEVERRIEGKAWQYRRGSLTTLTATREAQVQAICQVAQRMLALMPAVAHLGGVVSTSPMPVIETLLKLADHG